MALHQSGEDYLEAILMIREEKGIVRSIDVARRRGYSKPSVSRAVSLLKDSGHLTVEEDGRLELTALGEQVAREIYERHEVLTDWLVRLGVPGDIAAADACRIEHDLSPETFQCLKDHAKKMRKKT